MINTNLQNASKNAVAPSLKVANAPGRSPLVNITESSAKKPRATKNRYTYHLLEAAQKYMPECRVGTCQKIPVGSHLKSNNDYSDFKIDVGASEHGSTKFGGLTYCGNQWQCPCCAGIVGHKKVSEIITGMSENAKRGGQSLFLTLTQPHKSDNSLKTLVDIQSKALTSLFQNGTVKRYLKSHGYLGQIRAFEMTHSFVNGWHPHLHIVVMFNAITINKELEQLEQLIYKFWSKYIVEKGGMLPSPEYGVDLRLPRSGDEKEIGTYMAKYATEVTDSRGSHYRKMANELASSHTKKGRLKTSRTPFQILDDIADEYNYQDAKLLNEYAEATHKKTRIFWSPGLKAHFNIAELMDEEIASTPVRKVKFSLTWADYKVLRKLKLAGDLLDLSLTMPASYCQSWVAQVVQLDHQNILDTGAHNFRLRREMKQWILDSTRSHMAELGLM